MPKYRTNYLEAVVLRIDFVNALNNYGLTFPKDLEDILMKQFTLKESQDIFMEEVKFQLNRADSENVTRKRVESKVWNFFGNEKAKKLCLCNDYLFVAYNKYSSFDDFTTPFNGVLTYFKEKENTLKVKRIGMRYINKIKIEEDEPTSWEKYLNKNLLCIFKVPKDRHEINQAMHTLEIAIDDIRLKCQYGMPNPDYPACIKKKEFVLDFDAFKLGDMPLDEIEYLIPILHDNIEQLFERAITKNLRSLMKV